jgi:hypothetical protein
MTDKVTCSAPYLQDILDTKATVRKASLILRKGQWRTEEFYSEEETDWIARRIGRQRPIEFDTLVGIGLSGTLLLPMLADRLKCNYLALRKDKDGSHAAGCHQGVLGKKWLFFDDLISTGSTLQKAYKKINKIVDDHNKYSYDVVSKGQEPFKTEFVGAYLFTANSGLNLRPASDLIGRYGLPTPEFLAKEKERADRIKKELDAASNLNTSWYENYETNTGFQMKKDDWVLRA